MSKAPKGKKPGPGNKKNAAPKKKPTGKRTPPEEAAQRLIPGTTAGPQEGTVLPPRGPAVDAKDFLLAIMNADPERLAVIGVYQMPTLSQRVSAAAIVIPFTHQRKPVEVIHKQAASWTEKIQSAQDRLSTLRRSVQSGDEGTEDETE